jgi:hypothetical protein
MPSSRGVEQADDNGVDVPHLVRSGRAKPDLGLSRMQTESRAAAPVLAYEAVPRGGRGPDRAEPLGEDGERAGRDVPIGGRRDHLIARTSGGVSCYGDVRGQED